MSRELSTTRSAIRHREIKARAKRDAIASDEANLRMVVSIARGLHESLPSSFCLDDLIGEGNIALVRAAAEYDPDAYGGTPFTAFARKSIRGAMLDTARRNKLIENTRESIDDQGPERVSHEFPLTEAQTEARRGLDRLASHPTVEIATDRARMNRRIAVARSLLPPDQREILEVWYGDDEPAAPRPRNRRRSPELIDDLHLKRVARLLGNTPAGTQALHDRAIAGLRARLFPGSAWVREFPKAA